MAALTLGIGLTAFTSCLTLVDSLLGVPPYARDDSTIVFGEPGRDATGLAASPLSYDAIGLPPGVMSRGSAQTAETVNVRLGNQEKFASAQRVDAGFLPTLRVKSALPDEPPVAFDRGVMLSDAFWHESFGGDPRVVGRPIAVNGEVMMVRGVLPSDYRLFADIDLLLPIASTASSSDSAANLIAVARLAPGVSGESVARWMQARLASMSMQTHAAPRYETMPLSVVMTGHARPILSAFFVCSLLVLAIAGVNLSNLMLTRAVQRTHLTCLTIAFGGTGWRPRLPLIADIVAVSLGALAVGLPLTHVLVLAVRPFVPAPWLISALPIHLNGRACLAAGLAAVTVTTAAAMAGAVHASPDWLLRTQFASGGTSPADLARSARRLMVLVQTALATLLLVLGVTTASHLWRVTQIPLGFQASGASFVEINPDTKQFPTLGDVQHAVESIRVATVHMPGIAIAGVSTQLPVGAGFLRPFRSEHGKTSFLRYAMVSPGAMEAMGIPLVAGRGIAPDDGATTQPVAVVNQSYIDRVDSRGIGGWVISDSRLGTNRPLRIVGVVADTRAAGAERPADPTVFVSFAQVDPAAYAFIRRFVPTFVVLRGTFDAVADPPALQKRIHQAAPALAVGPQQSFRQLALNVTAVPRRNAALAAGFASVAVALACIGLYAVQALEAITRRRDIALRDALGATPLDLLGHVLARGTAMALPGVALGLVAAIILQRAFAGSALDTGGITIGMATAVVLLMLFAALGAMALPSLRAAAVRPVTILRGGLTEDTRS